MNKITTLLSVFSLLLFSVMTTAQSQRMVLLEEGTQASCPPCATQNPPFDALYEQNEDKAVLIKYQTSWPGFDQMNLDNPSDVADRIAYYGISGVPNALLNGSDLENDCGSYEGAPSCLDQAEIDAAYAEMSEFDMVISAEVVNGVLNVTGSVKATQAIEGDLKLRVAITEKLITIDDAPGGTNGETEYIHVMKAFIGGTAGFDLEDTWAVDDTYEFTETYDLGTLNMYHYDKIEVIAFVQNDADKFVHQAAKDSEVEVTVQFGNNVTAVNAVGLPAGICSGPNAFTPSIELQNGGNEPLTSLDIVYSINGGAPQTYEWTGDLSTLAKATVMLDPYEFIATAGADNDLNINLENPNGVADENNVDDAVSATLAAAIQSSDSVKVVVQLDNYGAETSWSLKDEAGTVLASGSGYASTNPNLGELIEEVVYIPETSNCLSFEILDSYGDGICCAYGQGYYQVLDNATNMVLLQGGEFASDDLQVFEKMTVVSNEELTNETAFDVYPNPTTGLFNVTLSTEISKDATLEVFDVLGKVVAVKGAASLSNSNVELDLTNMQNGVYFVRLISDNEIYTQSVTLQQ